MRGVYRFNIVWNVTNDWVDFCECRKIFGWLIKFKF